MKKFSLVCLIFCLLFFGCDRSMVNILTPIVHEYEKLASKSLMEVGDRVLEDEISIEFAIDSAIGRGAYIMKVEDRNVKITGGDINGVLYGSHQLIDQIKVEGNSGIRAYSEKPNVEFRAIKFNLPWDSYRHSPSLDQHIETCKDLAFWEQFLDMMVENRFNVLSLWNLHPFNFMICPDNYPSACTFSDEEMQKWQSLYHGIFKMAKDRGIETYIVNWNIYVPVPFAKKHGVCLDNLEHSHGGTGDTSQIIKDYTIQCVKQIVTEYPNLTGFGFSHGEVMGQMTPEEREKWLVGTFIEAIKMADRKVKLIHRVPLSANNAWQGTASYQTEEMTRKYIEEIDCVIEPIWVEIKFNWSHAHSTPTLVKTHGGKLHDRYWNPPPKNHKICWTVRNEDFFCLRWGNHEFVREHINKNVHDYVGGYFVGSECYIPAKDYFSKLDSVNWEYAFERQWLFYKTWGRLLYNPQTENNVFEGEFVYRYGNEYKSLFDAYTTVSKVPLLFASYFDLSWDFTFYAEGFLTTRPGKGTAFIDINTLISRSPLDPGYIGIKEYAESTVKNGEISGDRISPLQLSEQLKQIATESLEIVSELKQPENNSLRYEIEDVRAWSNIGLYLSHKINAGLYLEKYRLTGDEDLRKRSVREIKSAIGYWKQLVEVTEPIYKDMPLVHFTWSGDHNFHWRKLSDEVENDIMIINESVSY